MKVLATIVFLVCNFTTHAQIASTPESPEGNLIDYTAARNHFYPDSGILKEKVGYSHGTPGYLFLGIAASAIGYGFLAMHQHNLEELNLSTRHEIREDHPGFHTTLDNYLQYTPALEAFSLRLAGVKGEHTVADELCIYGISSVLMFGSVEVTKNVSHEQRPDHSDYKSFPSGHTANAFAAAEFLRTEYQDEGPWIAISGYTLATATGVLRVYNNRHWVSDVIAGAAFGFLSTRAAYAVNPWVEKHILGKRNSDPNPEGYTRLEWHSPVYPQKDSITHIQEGISF